MNKDWSDPEPAPGSVYGNNNIVETNVITIQALKSKFNTEFTTEGKYKEIKEDIQIKGVVTANDIQGNMYNEISIQDETGAIFIGIAQGGTCGYLPLGTEIIIDLRGLFAGNYRKSPTIGTPYTDKDGEVYVSRMSRLLWQQHFKYTGQTKELKPEVFAIGNTPTTWNIDTDAGKLGVLKGVTIKNGGYYNSDTKSYVSNVPFTESSTYSHPDYSTSWYFNEQNDQQTGGVQIYTSCYSDFAAKKLSHKKLQITGVFKRYRDQWEIIIRSEADVVELPDDWVPTDDSQPIEDVGSADAPKTVAEALAAITALEKDNQNSAESWYVKGKVKQVITTDENITKFKNIDYVITDDGNNELKVFRGKYIDGADFTIDNKVTVDKEVIVYGNLQRYVKNSTTTPEITNSKLISIN
jgi:hypothetical protein